jgi:hypothetical protein
VGTGLRLEPNWQQGFKYKSCKKPHPVTPPRVERQFKPTPGWT